MVSTSAAISLSTITSVVSVPALPITVPSTSTSAARVRPVPVFSMLTILRSEPSAPFAAIRIGMERSVPQSSSRTITSCATSTRRRVRYPESAVRSAVSARPFRAPWVEMKYSTTDRPSRKLDLIGRGMVSPLGLETSPRMPAICLTVIGDQAALVLALHLVGALLVGLQNLLLVRRRDPVLDGDGHPRAGRPVESGVLERVERGGHLHLRVALRQLVDDRRKLL